MRAPERGNRAWLERGEGGRIPLVPLFKRFTDIRCELRQIVLNHLPQKRQVDPKVFMNQQIPHSGDPAPWNVGILGSEVVRKILDRFANDFQTTDYGVLLLYIFGEGLELHPFGILLYERNCPEYFPQQDIGRASHRSGTSSPSTRSRISG